MGDAGASAASAVDLSDDPSGAVDGVDPATLWGKRRATDDKTGSVRSRATLVVCNVSLVGQWYDEAVSKLVDGGAKSVYRYYGSSRIRDASKLKVNSFTQLDFFGRVLPTLQKIAIAPRLLTSESLLPNRIFLKQDFDIVVTTFAVLASDYSMRFKKQPKGDRSPPQLVRPCVRLFVLCLAFTAYAAYHVRG